MHKLGRNIPGMLRNFSYRSAPWVPAPSTSTSTPPFKFRPGLLITTTVLGTGFLYWIDYKGIRTKYGRPLSVEERQRNLDKVTAKKYELKERMLELQTNYAELQTTYADYEKRYEEYIASERARIAEMKAEQLKGQVGGSY